MARNRFVLAALAVALLLAGCDSTTAGPPPRASAVSTSEAPTATSSTATAPDVVGMRLPEARQALQDKGYAIAEEIPAGDTSREIIEPANWVVEAQSPQPGAAVRSGEKFTLTVAKPTDDTTAAAPTKGVVPKVVCLDLQAAQEALRAAGFYYLTSSDATGQNRQQVVDRNWVVVAQSAAPGSSPDQTTKIDLSTVKLGEPTGDSGCPS
jgi:beta-lactam-binding protein with PASTA domain